MGTIFVVKINLLISFKRRLAVELHRQSESN